jgi:hypothetical protein
MLTPQNYDFSLEEGNYKSLDDKEISIRLFLDLSKVFDLVDHDILLRKMERMGIRRYYHLYNWK